jgi:hypothetical protein
MQQPKVLITCPVSDVKDYVLDRWLTAVRTITFAPCELLLVSNSRDRRWHRRFEQHGIKCLWVDPRGKSNAAYMAECVQHGRLYALKNGFTHFMSWECDVFPPCADIVERLLMHRRPVISALYHIGHGEQSHLCLQLIDQSTMALGMLDIQQLNTRTDLFFADGTVKQVYAAGLGCTLIQRNVLEKINFRHEPQLPHLHHDSLFYADLHAAGIMAFADTSILCEHDNQPWGVLLGQGM